MATEGFVCWTECEGEIGPCQYITNRGGGIDFRARINTITKPADATLILLRPSGTFQGIQCNIYRVIPIAPTVSTTTTTSPPISLTLTASCIGTGINGTGRIVANGFTGGTGTYANIRIGNTLSAALGATPIVLSGATSYQWDSLLNQTYYVVLTDSANNTNYASVGVNCTNTTTTTSTSTTTTSTTSTSTTTTTTAAPICTYNGGTAVVIYPSTTTTTSTSTTTAAPTTTTTTAAPTTTTTTAAPTTTTTTTTAASTNFLISDGFESPQECYGLGGPYPNSVYAASSVWYDPGGPYVTRFFTDSGMTTGFYGGDLYYGDQYSTFGTTLQIDNNGYVIGLFGC